MSLNRLASMRGENADTSSGVLTRSQVSVSSFNRGLKVSTVNRLWEGITAFSPNFLLRLLLVVVVGASLLRSI